MGCTTWAGTSGSGPATHPARIGSRWAAHGGTARRRRKRMGHSGSQLISTPSTSAFAAPIRADRMWLVYLALVAMALYVAVITSMYFAQTWLIFPTTFVQAGHVRLPASAQRLEIEAPSGDRLLGVPVPPPISSGARGPPAAGFWGA